MLTTEKLYTPSQIGRRFTVTPECVRDWIRKGRIRAVRLSRKTLRIPESEVQRLLAEGAAPPVVDYKSLAAGRDD